MVLAASCLYEVVVYLAVKRKSTFVDRRTKDKVIAMGRKARQGKATLFIAAAIVCFAPMIMSGILMAHAGYSPSVAPSKGNHRRPSTSGRPPTSRRTVRSCRKSASHGLSLKSRTSTLLTCW